MATELCRQFASKGQCQFGSNCKFAHDMGETRPKPAQPRSHRGGKGGGRKDAPEPKPVDASAQKKICRDFQTKGTCRFGARCRFSHESASPAKPAVAAPKQRGKGNSGRTSSRHNGTASHPQPNPQPDHRHGRGHGSRMSHGMPLPAPHGIPQPPQEYDTYLDKNTGHQRLRGGALLIVDPDWTEEQAKEAQAPLHVELVSEEGVTKRVQTVLPAFVHQVIRQELGLKGRIDVRHNGGAVPKASSFLDIGAIDGAQLFVSVFTLGFPLRVSYTMHHPFKHGSCIPDEDHPDWYPPVAAHDKQHKLSIPDLESAWHAVSEGGELVPSKEQARMRDTAKITKMEVADKDNNVVPLELLDELIAEKHESHSAELGTTYASLLATFKA